ncbi:NAD(P)-dependent oxidoreductase [Tardiphaga sp. 768_D3_N2_1]|uniref:NAD(P)-dependent oxidoreductase n=1 Tax=Tardiphaga sp. 768_D3_N2_1 TaxID=3240783 RepID=UPI003F8C5D50
MTTPSKDQTQAVAWIGVGKMGLPIAGRMVEAGIRVTGYDPGQQRMVLAQQLGLQAANSAAEAAANHSIIFTSLPDDAALRSVVLGPDGLLNRLTRGAVLVETSTVSAEISAEVGVAAEANGVAYLRAPVSGNAAIAHTGALTCFVSGPRDAFDAVQPVLATFTRAQTYLGVAEEARFAKLAVNLMIAVSAGMMAESLALARKGGISWPDILKVLDDSAVASPMVKYKTPPLATRNFDSTFSCRQMAKDLDLIIGAGHHVGVPLQLAAQVREIYGSLVAQGDGESDFIATVRHVERLSGLGEPKLG